MYKEGEMVAGKWVRNAYGTVWRAMKDRCKAGSLTQKAKPSYVGCQVSDSFQDLQQFGAWCDAQLGFKAGWQLDKDLLGSGKLYSAESCTFLPRELNMAIRDSRVRAGALPYGVSPKRGRYYAQLSRAGRVTHVGMFDTPEEARVAYVAAKISYVRELASSYQELLDPRAYAALKQWEPK